MNEFDFHFGDKVAKVTLIEDNYNGRVTVKISYDGKKFNGCCLNMGIPDYDLSFRRKLFKFFRAPLTTYNFEGAYGLRALFQFITNRAAGAGPKSWEDYLFWWEDHIEDREDVEQKFLED